MRKQNARDNDRNYYQRKRKEILDFLGGKCVKCGFSDYRALQIDHIWGGGTKERKEVKNNNKIIYFKKVIENKSKYQLLCANCNCIKRIENNEN